MILLAAAGLTLSFNSCKDDGAVGTTDPATGKLSSSDKAKLYDKPWYSTASSGGVTHEFLNDNTLRLSKSLDGRWNWINNGDTMDILDPSNARYRYLIKSITDHTMSFTFSIDNYKTVNSFKDTE